MLRGVNQEAPKSTLQISFRKLVSPTKKIVQANSFHVLAILELRVFGTKQIFILIGRLPKINCNQGTLKILV